MAALVSIVVLCCSIIITSLVLWKRETPSLIVLAKAFWLIMTVFITSRLYKIAEDYADKFMTALQKAIEIGLPTTEIYYGLMAFCICVLVIGFCVLIGVLVYILGDWINKPD